MKWFLAMVVAALPAAAQLSGNYTVDPNGTGPRNFPSFQAATAALSAGVTGPVLFNVAPGTYASVRVTAVPGASATNKITFRGVPGKTVIDAIGTRKTIECTRGAQHFRFEWFRLIRFVQFGVQVTGIPVSGAGLNEFHGLEIIAPATSNPNLRAIDLAFTNGNRFTDCIVRGGGHCLHGSVVHTCTFDRCEFDGLGASNSVVLLLAAVVVGPVDADNAFRNCFIHSPGPTNPAVDLDNGSYGFAFWNNTVIASSSHPAMTAGGFQSWTNAASVRNNIIANFGTGSALRYQEESPVMLPPVDVDFNCYWAPNSGGAIETRNGFIGDLVAWRKLQSNFPGTIPPGGSPSYDRNSIEADPRLGAAARPFNIHLTTASPAIDAGTSTYVPGPWMTFPASGAVVDDIDGETRGGPVDIGADEAVAILRGSGPTSPGTTHQLALSSRGDAGLLYQVVSSSGIGPINFVGQQLGLGLDPLFFLTITNAAPSIFRRYSSFLDSTSRANAQIDIPALPLLVGHKIRSAFLVGQPAAPFGVKRVSGTYEFVIR